MFCLVYASAGVTEWSALEVEAMLLGFREKNASLNITGLLLYKDGSFLQALEGEESVVRKLYDTIASDPRHQQVTLMLEIPIEERSFPDWSMGLKILPTGGDGAKEGVKSFQEAFDDVVDQSDILEFLRSFSERM